jgi:hypothetical protein
MKTHQAMRYALALLTAALAACGPGRSSNTPNVPTLEPRSENSIRIYRGTVPRCGFREVGTVSGSNYRDLQSQAFRLHANAVILDPQGGAGRIGGTGTSGTAVAFTRADCMQ